MKIEYINRSISNNFMNDWFFDMPFQNKKKIIFGAGVKLECDILVEDWNGSWKNVILDDIRHIKVKGVILSDEHRRHVPLNYLKRFDFACYKNPLHGDSYSDVLNVYWLPNCAFDDEINIRTAELTLYQNRRYDVSFVGGRVDGKKKILPNAIEKLEKMGIKTLFCTNKRFIYGEMIDVYQNSKIVINESTKQLDLNLRVFEAMISGAMLLTNDCKNDIDKLFQNKKHLAFYNDEQDLIDKVKYYLKNYNERIAIEKNGYEEVRKNHCKRNRDERLLEIIKKYNR